jgi:hypothetical protein
MRNQFIFLALLVAAIPSIAHAQYNAPSLSNEAIGERYHVELTGTLWNPQLTGVVASEQFGQIPTDIDFVTDLGFLQTRFRDVRAVLRPSKKQKFRLQYTPIDYVGTSTLRRDVVFNGIRYPINLPVASEFSWKVFRFGYEYDAFYKDRGFVGIILEGRYTQMTAEIQSTSPLLVASDFTTVKAPLPALGIIGRGYPARNVAIDFEMTGFKLPDIDPQYQANYYDWDIHGTVNPTNTAGIQVGWRRMTTFLKIKKDSADFKFQGMYFGGVLRY